MANHSIRSRLQPLRFLAAFLYVLLLPAIGVLAIAQAAATDGLPQFLIADEVAELLRLPKATLYQWRTQRIGPPARRVGRRLLYSRDEVLQWIQSQPTTAA